MEQLVARGFVTIVGFMNCHDIWALNLDIYTRWLQLGHRWVFTPQSPTPYILHTVQPTNADGYLQLYYWRKLFLFYSFSWLVYILVVIWDLFLFFVWIFMHWSQKSECPLMSSTKPAIYYSLIQTPQTRLFERVTQV